MTYSEYMRIMEVTEAQVDNIFIDIDFIIESAKASHKLDVADLDYKFASSNDYTTDAMVDMYTEEAEEFDSKMKSAWNKFCEWVNTTIEKMNKLKQDASIYKDTDGSHPDGIELTFDAKATVKAMMKIAPMVTSSSLKKLNKEVRDLEKEGTKVSISLKKDSKYSSGINSFIKAGSEYVESCSAPSKTTVSPDTLFEYVSKTIDFATKIQKMCEDVKGWKDDVPTWAVTPLKEILTTATSVVTAGSKSLSSTSGKTKEIKKNTTTSEVDASKSEKKEAKEKPVAANKNSLKTTKKVEESTSIDDGTIFSNFFESSDMIQDNDRTNSFLNSTSKNMNEIRSIVESFL